NAVGHKGLGDDIPIDELKERGGDVLLSAEERTVLHDTQIRPGNLLEVDVGVKDLCGGTSRSRLRGRAVGVVAKLDKIGGFRIECESFEDQADPSHVELAHVLFKLPGCNDSVTRDVGIVLGVSDGAVGAIQTAVGVPELKANADLQLELVLELGV